MQKTISLTNLPVPLPSDEAAENISKGGCRVDIQLEVIAIEKETGRRLNQTGPRDLYSQLSKTLSGLRTKSLQELAQKVLEATFSVSEHTVTSHITVRLTEEKLGAGLEVTLSADRFEWEEISRLSA